MNNFKYIYILILFTVLILCGYFGAKPLSYYSILKMDNVVTNWEKKLCHFIQTDNINPQDIKYFSIKDKFMLFSNCKEFENCKISIGAKSSFNLNFQLSFRIKDPILL